MLGHRYLPVFDVVGVLLLALPILACEGDPSSPAELAPDTIPPLVRIVYPVDSVSGTSYDENGNGLIDIRASWSDAESGIDEATAHVELTGLLQGGSSGNDLGDLWTEVERGPTGLTYEETIAYLARRGTTRLIVSVADSAGNRGADTTLVRVRYGDFHRSVAIDEPGVTSDVVVCEDDERLYAVRGFAILVFDANTFEHLGTFPRVLAEPPARMLCIPGDPILYSTVRVERFDRTSLSWLGEIPGTFRTDGIAHSRRDPNIIWGGEWGLGVPVRIDRAVPERLGGVGLPASSHSDEFTVAVAVLEDDRKIYYSRAREGGLVVGDPTTGQQLAHIDLDVGSGLGRTSNIVVGRDDRYVYAAVRGELSGLAVVDTETDEVTRMLYTPDGVAFDVARNADGTRLWVTTQDIDPTRPSASVLLDPFFWEGQEMPRPVPEGTETLWVQAAAFHPNGKLLFQARDHFIDVYLIR